MKNKIDRIKVLVKELNQYRHSYYNLDNSIVSDSKYDKLFDELSQLEKETGYVLSISPTVTVGYEVVSKLNKVTHDIPLLSLDKTKEVKDIVKFKGNYDILMMLKDDGLTVELNYDDGILIQGSTRGNGIIGEDITINVRQFKNIPLTIPYKGKLSLTGEALIHYNDFKIINSKLPEGEKYKNPRNLTSGSVRQLSSKECANRFVYFYAFNILECDTELSDSKKDRFIWLHEQGFTITPYTKLNDETIDTECTLEDHISIMKTVAETKHIPIDGLVITYDSVNHSESLGKTSHHPLHSLAFKFQDELSETILREIEWSLGKTGQITPVAIFDEVEIYGTTVARASLHNLSIMEELELGIGDDIGVTKGNMIIPQVIENYTRSNNIVIPDNCPVCNGDTEIKQDKDSKVLICTNDDCSGKFIKKLSHFVSRDAMNIEGLSEQTLDKLVEMGFIEEFADIYRLEQYKKEIISLDGFGLKSYNKLIEAINKSRNSEMNRVIYSLSIPLIGRSASKAIAKHFNYNIDDFMISIVNDYDFTVIEDFGLTTNESIYNWFNWFNNINVDILQNLLDEVNIKKPEEKQDVIVIDNPFKGKKVYGTGTFADYKKEELKTLLENLGAEFASGYAKSLDYLIVGSIKGSSKEDKARKDNIKVLTEDDFNKMIGKVV